MLLGSRRLRVLSISLAGMDVAWFLPFVLTWIARSQLWNAFELPIVTRLVLAHPLLIFSVCWMTMLAYMLTVDLVDLMQIVTPKRELIVVLTVFGTTALGARMLLYPLQDITSMAWVLDSASAIMNFSDGLRPPLLFLLVNVFLWVRVANAADREISFFSVGMGFRSGMLLALLGGALLSTVGGQPATVSMLFLVLFLLLGLTAVALARIDEKSVGHANTSGASIPTARLAQIVAFAGVILGLALIVQHYLSPAAIRDIVSVLNPLWTLMAWVLTVVLIFVFLLIGPLIERLMITLERMAAGAEPIQPGVVAPLPTDFVGVESMVRDWVALRYCLVTGAVVLLVAFLWFLFVQPAQHTRTVAKEDISPDETGTAWSLGRSGLETVRDWLRMLRDYGASQRMLNAVSVQNMYANIGRIARARGYPRHPSQPPDRYLPELKRAFPGQDDALERLTRAYMQVHYGEFDLNPVEIHELRLAYTSITETPFPEPSN